MPQQIKKQGGNLISNSNAQVIKASNQKKDSMKVKVVKGGDLRAK